MKRILLTMILASATAAYACSSKTDDTNNNQVTPPDGTEQPGGEVDAGGTPTEEAGPGDSGPTPTEDPSGNPILLGAPRQVRSFTPAGGAPHFVDGPAWLPARSALVVALPFALNNQGGKGILTTFKADGTNYLEVRAGDDLNTGVIGNSIDKDGNLISAELKAITRTAVSAQGLGAVSVVATGTGDPAAPTPFNTLNDLVALDDGTIFATDPGYRVDPRPANGYLYMVAPAATVATVAATYDYNPSPNGIALSKDQKTLFVGFTAPPAGTPPFIRKYAIGAGGALTDGGKLVELPVGSEPDGIAVDDSGNIYVALKTGIAVFKATGEPYGGAGAKIPQTAVDGEPTSLAFGGADKKSLFITTKNGRVLELKTKVAGLLH